MQSILLLVSTFYKVQRDPEHGSLWSARARLQPTLRVSKHTWPPCDSSQVQLTPSPYGLRNHLVSYFQPLHCSPVSRWQGWRSSECPPEKAQGPFTCFLISGCLQRVGRERESRCQPIISHQEYCNSQTMALSCPGLPLPIRPLHQCQNGLYKMQAWPVGSFRAL